MNKAAKFWIGVACKEHVENGVKLGICQFCHGKSVPAKRLSRGDSVIYYSSKITMAGSDLYQKFTAIGEFIDDAPYQVDMGEGFKPFRRNINYFDAKHIDIKPLVPLLPFIKNKNSWGYVFRYGFLEIDQKSFEIIAGGMLEFNPLLEETQTMLIKPDVKDEEIIACLRDAYGLDIATVSFLPLGADFNTAVYRITTSTQTDYFLKLRSGEFLEASVSVPKYLADLGIKQVIPTLTTKTGQLSTSLGDFKAILYPYVEGRNGVEAKLSDQQWAQFGAAIKKLHSTDIPASITKDVPRETFSSKWRETVKAFLVRIDNEVFEEPVAVKMAAFLKSKRCEILKLVERAEELALAIQKQPLTYVLCHADMHGWNLFVDKENALYIVDWDTLIFAPKERDLMFIGAGIWDSGLTPDEEDSLFYHGYTQTKINRDAIAYYRFERIIQDIGDYLEYIFLSDEGGDDRMQCFEHLQPVFRTYGAIERAYDSYNTRKM